MGELNSEEIPEAGMGYNPRTDMDLLCDDCANRNKKELEKK